MLILTNNYLIIFTYTFTINPLLCLISFLLIYNNIVAQSRAEQRTYQPIMVYFSAVMAQWIRV